MMLRSALGLVALIALALFGSACESILPPPPSLPTEPSHVVKVVEVPSPDEACAKLAEAQRAVTTRIEALTLPSNHQEAVAVVAALQSIADDIDALHRDWLPMCRLAVLNKTLQPSDPTSSGNPADASSADNPDDAPPKPPEPTTHDALVAQVYLPHQAHLRALHAFARDAASRLKPPASEAFIDIQSALSDALDAQHRICEQDISPNACEALKTPKTPNPHDASP